MAQKFALVLAVLAVSCIAIKADTTTATPSSNFVVAPKTVVDNSSDTNFANYTKAVFVPGSDNTTIYVFGLNYSASDAALSLVRRSINASTITAINGSDTKIASTIPTNGTYTTVVGLGYIGVATVYNSTGNFPDVTLYYSAVNGSSFSNVKLTSNTDENITYYFASTWYDAGYFYITYIQSNSSTSVDQAAYIQAVKVSDGSKLFNSTVKVATLNETNGNSFVIAGPTNASNSSSINVLYRTNIANSTYYVTVANSTAGTPVTLFTDAGNVTYQSAGTLGSFSNSAVFVKKIDASSSPSTNSTYGFYNGNTTAVLVAGSSMSGYSAPYVTGSKFVDGYVLLEAYSSASSSSDAAYYLDYYFANQTRNGSAQTLIGTYGNPLQTFVDANGAAWAGYYTKGDWLMKASIGQIIAQINAASVLASFFAFISLMIAALFAF